LGNRGTTATTTLGATQGNSEADYARAFALGNGFKIYIGGRLNLTNRAPADVFTPVLANKYDNTVNICVRLAGEIIQQLLLTFVLIAA
jgi:hypothetical protein